MTYSVPVISLPLWLKAQRLEYHSNTESFQFDYMVGLKLPILISFLSQGEFRTLNSCVDLLI